MKRTLVFALAGAVLLAGCSGGDGSNGEALRSLAGAQQPTQPAPTETARIAPTVTPDYQPDLIAPTGTPQSTPEALQAMPEQPTETPQPWQTDPLPTEPPACDPAQPYPMPLDASDVAAGVIVKGASCEAQR
jgi:outer membrane biosynthesis protein TonB